MKLLQMAYLMLCLFFGSCDMESKELLSYYNSHAEIHQQIAEGLIRLSRIYKANIQIRKQIDGDINFSFYINSPEPKLIVYDYLLHRDNSYTKGASQFIVSDDLIKNINKIRYRTIGADSNHTFFGDAYRVKDVYDGILIIDKSQVIDKVTKMPYKGIAPYTYISQESLH